MLVVPKTMFCRIMTTVLRMKSLKRVLCEKLRADSLFLQNSLAILYSTIQLHRLICIFFLQEMEIWLCLTL